MERDLSKNEGIIKIKKIISGCTVGMMATNLVKIPFSVCPMTTLEIDDQANLLFFSNRNSDHYKDINNDNRVQILYSNEVTHEYLSLFGNAVELMDQNMVDKLWNPMVSAWFDGTEDPDLVLLSVNIDQAQYWDSNINRLIPLFEKTRADRNKNGQDMGSKGYIDLDNY